MWLLRTIWQLQIGTIDNMLYNLRNGSTIRITVERYLEMSDEDLDKLELYYRGAEINDPFFASVLVGKPRRDEDEEEVDIDSLDVPPEELSTEEEEDE